MERQVDNEKWEVIQRLENRYYTYTIRKDCKYKIKGKDIRILMTKCLEKPERIEYFVFVNKVLIHCYSDALQVLDGLDIQDKTETVDYAPDYNVLDLFWKESIVETFRENVARYRKGDTYYEEYSYKLVKSDEK